MLLIFFYVCFKRSVGSRNFVIRVYGIPRDERNIMNVWVLWGVTSLFHPYYVTHHTGTDLNNFLYVLIELKSKTVFILFLILFRIKIVMQIIIFTFTLYSLLILYPGEGGKKK